MKDMMDQVKRNVLSIIITSIVTALITSLGILMTLKENDKLKDKSIYSIELTIDDHEGRLRGIESNRYMQEDADRDLALVNLKVVQLQDKIEMNTILLRDIRDEIKSQK